MFVSVEALSKSYGERASYVRVLDDVTLEIEQGQIVVIQGASGSGKSTLLNCIGGLDRPDSGRIRVGDTQVTGLNPRRLTEYRRLRVGFIFQFYNLIPNLTVWENIQVCEKLSPKPMPLTELLDSLGLMEHRTKFPSQLSGGQQQRCAIARALVKRPDLILCDEPTGALDYATSIDVLEVLERVNREHGATLGIVTHNPGIADMAHQVLQMRDGKVVQRHRNQVRASARSLSW